MQHAVVSRQDWLAARKVHLAKELEMTHALDALRAERRQLPWVKIEKGYVFDGQDGKCTLIDLFGERSQLAVYHFMLSPGSDHICPGCSYTMDHVDAARQHFEQADLAFAAVSRAPIARIEHVKARMGWTFLWVSSGAGDFNYDTHGQGYARQRRTDPRIAALVHQALGSARTVLNIGAGAGSVAIEWMLADLSMRAVAIEADGERSMRIRRNALAFGVPDLEVVHGEAPQALADLAQPDAVFVGGGGSGPGVVEAAIAALKPGGTLVANAVTLEFEALLLARQAVLGGSLTRVAVSHAEPVGSMTGWRPAMPVTQWVWIKGEAS